MVYWHLETDYIALLIYIVLFIKAVVLNRQKDFTDRIFSVSLVLGFFSTLIDIFSSVMMNDLLGWWIYEISMIIYGLSVPVLALLWFLYTVSLIYRENSQRIRQFVWGFSVLYALYAAVIVTNPLHELYFHLTADMVYSRGVLFIPLIVWSQTLMGGAGILLLLLNWRRMQPKSTGLLLLFLHVITAGVYYLQIAHPGWLIVCSTYAVAFLVCDATFEGLRRDRLYRELAQSNQELHLAVQEATRANQAKTEFLSRMSHDIRTPINGIRGMLEIIRKEQHDPARVDDCLNKIETASGHLLSLINDVLDMSKLESGEVILASQPFDLRQVMQDCRTVLLQLAVDSGVLLTDDGLESVKRIPHPYLIGSPLHLRQVILNVVGNAIKYNRPGGSVRCLVEEIGCTGEEARFRFTVEDTGVGISPDFLPLVFQPFAQEHVGSRTQFEGTGLGLSIVKKIIDRMGGEISVQSTQGVGSIFVFTLSLPIDPAPQPQSAAPQPEPEETPLKGMRLLLVEDNSLNLEIAQYILEDAGAEVDAAENGQEALERFQSTPPGTYSAVLMDIMMPVMDGYAATRAIRAAERADAGSIPIIAMTANAFADDVQRCLDAGMNAHLAKPLDSVKLLTVLSDLASPTH